MASVTSYSSGRSRVGRKDIHHALRLRLARATVFLPRARTIKRPWTVNALTAIGCASFAFDDVAPLRGIGGGLLASPGWLFLAVAVIAVGSDRPALGRWPIWASGIVLYGLAISLISAMALPDALLGVSTVGKLLRLGLTVAIWCAVPLAGYILMQVAPKAVFVGIAAGFSILLLSLIAAKLGLLVVENSNYLHSIPNIQQRVRGSRFEPSSLGGGYIVLGTFACIVIRGRLGIAAVVAILVVGQYLTASRGTAVVIGTVLLASIVALCLNRSAWSWLRVRSTAVATAVVAVTLALSFGLTAVLQSSIWKAVAPSVSVGSAGTSDATRALWSSTALRALWENPFGYGFVAYLESVQRLMRDSLDANFQSFRQVELTEVFYLINTTSDFALAPKTLPALGAIHLGIVGLVAVGALYVVSLRASIHIAENTYYTASLCTLSVILVSSTFLSSLFLWEQPFILGAIAGWYALQQESPKATGRHAATTHSLDAQRIPS